MTQVEVENWTPERVKLLWEWQRRGHFHPFTCPNRGDGNHPEVDGDRGVLVPTMRGWVCMFCDYTQDWAHDFMMSEATIIPFTERKVTEHVALGDENEDMYLKAFPDFDYALPVIPGFEDRSWKNDVCPKLWNEHERIVIYCDYADAAKREINGGVRFTVYRTNEDMEPIAGLYEADSEEDLLAAIAELVAIEGKRDG